MKQLAYTTFALKVQDVDKAGMIRGYASVFGNEDLGNDVVDRGCFKKSIQETGGVFPILAHHDPKNQIGWNVRAREDDTGLDVEGKLDLNVQVAREQHSLAKGALELGGKLGLSIGYSTIKWEWDRDKPHIRHLKEVKLWEYSITPFPMNTSALITDAKSMADLDRAHFYIKELLKTGVRRDDLALALRNEAAESIDPKALQSFDRVIAELRRQ